MSTKLTTRQFTNEDVAIAHVERSRWADGVFCPHCGSVNVHRMGGKTQAGYFLCNDCRDKFTCRTGTVMERSHIPVHKWLLAIHLLTSSKKGMSAHQLHRTLGLTYKSAWFLAHRIREAMRPAKFTPMGGSGKTIEVDETLMGFQEGTNSKTKPRPSGSKFRNIVLTLVERGGSARSFHVEGATMGQLIPILRTNINRESNLMSDEGPWYTADRQRVCFAWHCEPLRERVRPRRDHHQHRRRLLFDLQARHERHLSALQRETLAPLSVGIRFPLLVPHRHWLQRYGSCRARVEGHRRQEAYLSTA